MNSCCFTRHTHATACSHAFLFLETKQRVFVLLSLAFQVLLRTVEAVNLSPLNRALFFSKVRAPQCAHNVLANSSTSNFAKSKPASMRARSQAAVQPSKHTGDLIHMCQLNTFAQIVFFQVSTSAA